MQLKYLSPLLLIYVNFILHTSQLSSQDCPFTVSTMAAYECLEGVTLTPGNDDAFIDLDKQDAWREERRAPSYVLQYRQTVEPKKLLVRAKRGVESWSSYGITKDCQKKKLELGKRVTQKEPLPPVAH